MPIDYDRSDVHMGVFERLGSIKDTVVVHEQIPHMNRFRDIYKEQLYPELQQALLSKNRDVIQAQLERIKWLLARDPRQIDAIAKEIYGKQCIVITSYSDVSHFINKSTDFMAREIKTRDDLIDWERFTDKPAIVQSGFNELHEIDLLNYIVYYADIDWHGGQVFKGKEVHFFRFKDPTQRISIDLITNGATIDTVFDSELLKIISERMPERI